MANELKISGKMHVKTLKSQFKEVFGLTLRVYDGRSFADDNSTLAQVRKGDAKGGEFAPQRNTKVGSFEDKMMSMFGIKVQVAGSDDSYLCNNDLTLAGAQEEDKRKMEKKARDNVGHVSSATMNTKKDDVFKNESDLKNDTKEFSLEKQKALEMVLEDSENLKNVDKKFLADKDIVLAAVKSDGFTLEYADKELRKDREIVLVAISTQPYALQFADESFKKDKEIVMIAVSKAGIALKFADSSLKKDRDIVLTAVINNTSGVSALQYADDCLKKDREIAIAAISSNSRSYSYVDDSLKNDPEILAIVNK